MVRRLRFLLLIALCVGVVLALAAPAMGKRPTHFMIVVIDQMQPGYAQQFDMANVLSLQKKGVTFPNAYVGHMASETVIAHNVMVSGQFPKHMGWSDEAFRDVDNIIGYGADAIVTSGDLGYADYTTATATVAHGWRGCAAGLWRLQLAGGNRMKRQSAIHDTFH